MDLNHNRGFTLNTHALTVQPGKSPRAVSARSDGKRTPTPFSRRRPDTERQLPDLVDNPPEDDQVFKEVFTQSVGCVLPRVRALTFA